MAAISKFDEPTIQALCDVLGDTDTGLTGSEIGRFLRECNFHDPLPAMTKRYRLSAAFLAKQNNDGCANNIINFVLHVMNPVRHVGNREYFETERAKLNGVLAFKGLTLGEDGKVSEVKA
ncbi:MAG: hypothetical protein WA410_13785, partial [Candidatus Binatus sp.]